MSSIQAYKAHKQERTRCINKGHLAHLPYISGCILIVGYATQFSVIKPAGC